MAENDSSCGLGYFVLGLAAGTVAAVLFAPRSGEETRGRIAATAQEGMVYAKDTVEDIKEQLQVGLDCAEDAVMQFKNRVEASVTEAREKIQSAVEAGKNAYQEELNHRQAASGTAF